MGGLEVSPKAEISDQRRSMCRDSLLSKRHGV
ncbi:uncharacterized protein METZ01_LOCUS92838 [marine metagenome]|uniref:Uncharacterized protein n=1 Tax=marine metagenome TaxID=408172 RepID=A0A381VIH4_9ZZZZ